MDARATKKPTAFRLDEGLVGRLREEAKKANRSLSNYVECILMDSVYTEPNEATLEALREAKERNYTGRKKVDTSSVEAMIKSCEE
ncbi:MAG: toxin-antitoxin system protein [Tannerellaceae bacterium]|jgi:predicted transcriptional regulator|nr:toxin-antitoxin system protein [Tannerellaceae bacterium]